VTPRAPTLLRRLARLLIRGPEAPYVLGDLDDGFERDVARGLPAGRVRRRYLLNLAGSSLSLLGARMRSMTFPFSWIDVRLAFRMLVKYPALTVVALFALAIGVPVGLAPMHFVEVIEGQLPEDPDGRIQMLRYGNAPTTASDLFRWRTALTSFEQVGALRQSGYNVESADLVTTVSGAEVTASVLAMLGTRPRLGRTFSPADEQPGAPAVAIVGHDLWRTMSGGAGDLAGRVVQIGGVPHDVIGVMPEGFEFPRRQQVWVPLRDRPMTQPDAERPLTILGRLAHGVSAEKAQVELAAVAALIPDGGNAADRLIPEVVPTAFMVFGFPKGGLRATPDFFIAQVLTLVPLFVACVNVGLLIFARTAARTSELAVRTALGATRARILAQVFTESLLLALLATGAGLLLLGWVPEQVLAMAGIPLPYWMNADVSAATVIRALALAALAAAIAGVVPVLRSTGRGLQGTIQRANANRSGERFGGRSSALIIADVAVAVAVVGLAAGILGQLRATAANPDSDGIQAERYLTFDLRLAAMPGTGGSDGLDRQAVATRMALTQRALVDRLKSEPGVRAVAVGSVLPRMEHQNSRVELADGAEPLSRARIGMVDVDYFAELRQPILSGRAFDAGDLRDGAHVVIVNTSFVTNTLGGANPLGRRLRFLSWDEKIPPGPWYEIVGVVGHLGMRSVNADADDGVYRPLAPGAMQPVHFAVELGSAPLDFAPRLREIGRDVGPQAVISTPSTLDRQFEGDWYILAAAVAGGLVFVGVLLTLAASAIYAILSFTVVQRTREIGIRVALGADRTKVVLDVVRRALLQIGVGVAVGMIPASWIFLETQRSVAPDQPIWLAVLLALLPGVAIMVTVALVACAAPTLRALRISPADALRGDGL
jgi:predicted permease